MTSEADPAARPGHDWVVIASFENRHAAEHVLASLGHELRRNARKGRSDAFVVSGNADGSLKLTESPVRRASGFAAIIAHLSASMPAGSMPDFPCWSRLGQRARLGVRHSRQPGRAKT
jgi:hypothetical protein